MWCVIVRSGDRSRRLLVGAGTTKINLDDLRVAVTPCSLHELRAVSGGQIYQRIGSPARYIRRCLLWLTAVRRTGRRHGESVIHRHGNNDQEKKSHDVDWFLRVHLLPPPTDRAALAAPTFAMSSSSCGELPLTPMAPTTLPLMTMGMPP